MFFASIAQIVRQRLKITFPKSNLYFVLSSTQFLDHLKTIKAGYEMIAFSIMGVSHQLTTSMIS